MYSTCKRSSAFFLLFFFVVEGSGQPIVDMPVQASDQVSLGAFRQGWATIREGRDEYYIDTQGEKLRIDNPNNVIWGAAHAIDEYNAELQENPVLLPRNVILFERNGLWGIVDPKGEVVIPAEYNHIDIRYRQFWKLHKGSKVAVYLPDGDILPFFEDIGYLDGEYFDVKQDDAWHIYRKSAGRIITNTAYEEFDYCGGCGSTSPYVYAKKNGKWGIIDWQGNVLVPFEFDHEHRSMRSDNWVASF